MKAIFYTVILTGFIGGLIIMFGSLILVMKFYDPVAYLFFAPATIAALIALKLLGFIGGKK
jgi:hypothetical protein